MHEYVINSDRKTISQRLLTFFIWFEVHIQQFLLLIILQISDPGGFYRSVPIALSIPQKKLNPDILGSLTSLQSFSILI